MSWKTSTKFRLDWRGLCKQLDAQDKRWHAILDARVKVFTPEELQAFASARGVEVSKGSK